MTCKRNNLSFACLYFLNITHHLLIVRSFCRNKDNGHFFINKGNRPMLHFSRWIAFSMYIADLFELQGAFKCHRKVISSSEVKEVFSIVIFLGNFLYLVSSSKHSSILEGIASRAVKIANFILTHLVSKFASASAIRVSTVT